MERRHSSQKHRLTTNRLVSVAWNSEQVLQDAFATFLRSVLPTRFLFRRVKLNFDLLTRASRFPVNPAILVRFFHRFLRRKKQPTGSRVGIGRRSRCSVKNWTEHTHICALGEGRRGQKPRNVSPSVAYSSSYFVPSSRRVAFSKLSWKWSLNYRPTLVAELMTIPFRMFQRLNPPSVEYFFASVNFDHWTHNSVTIVIILVYV